MATTKMTPLISRKYEVEEIAPTALSQCVNAPIYESLCFEESVARNFQRLFDENKRVEERLDSLTDVHLTERRRPISCTMTITESALVSVNLFFTGQLPWNYCGVFFCAHGVHVRSDIDFICETRPRLCSERVFGEMGTIFDLAHRPSFSRQMVHCETLT